MNRAKGCDEYGVQLFYRRVEYLGV